MKKTIPLIIILVLVLGILGLAYLLLTRGYQNGKINIPPVTIDKQTDNLPSSDGSVVTQKILLTITSPVDGATLGSTNVTVKGKTVANAEVFVNDQAGKADAGGNFSINIGLDEGENQLLISANDEAGNVAEESIIVTVASFE
jgi:hypothetical protein